MRGILFCLLLFVGCLFSLACNAQSNYDWRGNVSADWSIAGNWRVGGIVATTPPGLLDNVFIGDAATAFTNQPTIPSTYQTSVASVTFGTVKVVALTVDGQLTITNDLTQKHSSSGANITPTIVGSGTVNCKNLINGDATAPPAPTLALTSQTFTTLLRSTVANLNVSGSLKMNSTSATATLLFIVNHNVSNPVFYLDGGNMFIGTSIATTNSNYINATVNSVVTRNLAEFFITSNTADATLTLAGANALAFDANGAGGADFYNSGTFTSTVIYNGAVDQTIYGTGQTRFGRSPANYQNVSFTGAGLKNSQTDSLTVGGNWTSSGGKVDVVTQNTTVAFKGTTAQTITDSGSDGGTGVTFKNVFFTGGGGKTFTSGRFIINSTGILYMGSGNTTLNANGNLTLQSRTASTASVAPIPTGSTITGNVAVQRLLIGGNTKSGNVYTARGYRMLTSPVNINGTGLYSLNYIGLTALTGGSGTGFTVTNNNPTIYLFREDVIPSNTTFNSGKHKGVSSINADNTVNVSGTTGSFQIPAGNGYIFYFVGNISNPATKASGTPTTGPENTIITATGNLNQGNVVTRLWYTPAGATVTPINTKLSYSSALGTSAGYNMVGNPYAATLDLAKVITDNSTITNSIYVLDNVNPGQQYIAYSPAGSSSPKATQYVTSGQGFIVKATGINATLTFRESEKAVGFQPATLLMGLPVAQAPATGFYLKIEKDSTINDYCGVYFSGSSSANFDLEDAKDLDGTTSQIYMSSYSADGVRTAINHMPDYYNGLKTRLYVNAAADGIYKLKIEEIRNIDTLYDIWLKDRYKKDSLDIRRYGTYNFNIIRSDTASFGGNRFEIVVRRKPMPPYQLVNFTASKVTEGIQLSWKTYNEGNFTGFIVEKLQPGTNQYTPLYSIQSSGKTIYSFVDKQPIAGVNTYRLQQNDINNIITWSAPININVADPTNLKRSLINVFPNPAVSTINVSLSPDLPATGYISKIYNYSGSVVSNQTVQGNNWTQDVGGLLPGTYIIELNKNTGELVGRSKFIKK